MGVVFIQQNIDMKKFLWVIGGVLMLWGIPLSGQQSVAPEIPESAVRMTKVSGQVVDENTGDGIPLATISVTGLGWGTVCDMKGYFKVEVPVNQPAELTVRSVGYETKTLVLESDVTGNLVVRLKKSLLNLDEVTVTGTRTEKTVAETPVMTRIVPSEVLQRNDFESMIDVLEYNIPGLRFNTDPRGNNIQVQGLENSYILILVDGERLSTTPGGPIDFDRLTTANIKKIEVLKVNLTDDGATRRCYQYHHGYTETSAGRLGEGALWKVQRFAIRCRSGDEIQRILRSDTFQSYFFGWI